MAETDVTRSFLDALHKDLATLRDEQRGTTNAVQKLESTMASVATKLEGVADLNDRVRDLELNDARNGSTADLADRVTTLEKWQAKVIGASVALGAASGGGAAMLARAIGG